MDVKFTQSTDGGIHWSTPVTVNDNVDAPGVPTDQFQPSIAAGPNGAVAVAFYDRRLPCPRDASVLPADVGPTNFCIDVSLQPYKDSGSGAAPIGGNARITDFSWDPQQPGQKVGGLPQLPCADANCHVGFIGDYFGLAISGKIIYGLFVSTHYPLRRDCRRRRPGLLPAASARDSAAHRLRRRLLSHPQWGPVHTARGPGDTGIRGSLRGTGVFAPRGD